MIKDKVVVVTGASSGIGYETALTLAKTGAKVAAGARRIDKLENLQKEIQESDGEILIEKLDVTKKEDCSSFINNVIGKWNHIDILINNKSGHIINISSVAGRIIFPAGSVYCATKHAITAFSEGLRQELSQRYNIKVTCIEPGVVATDLPNTITDKSLEGFIESVKKMEALQAVDIANAILYAVDSPRYVNVNEILLRPLSQEK